MEQLWHHEMDFVNYQLYFLEKLKDRPLLMKESKMVRWKTTKKNLSTYWIILKVVANLDLQRVFDRLLANYLISKEFLKWIGYISIYLLKSKHKKIKKKTKQKQTNKLYGLFLWMKSIEPQRGDSSIFTTKSLGVRGIHFIVLGMMKGWFDLGVTQ